MLGRGTVVVMLVLAGRCSTFALALALGTIGGPASAADYAWPILRVIDGAWLLESDHPSYPPVRFPDDAEVVGETVWVARTLFSTN